MIACKNVKENISKYIDGDMDENTYLQMETHFKTCNGCAKELMELRDLIAISGEIPDEELPENFELELHKRLSQSRIENVKAKAMYFGNYAKIASVAAACILLAFLFKGFYPYVQSDMGYNVKSRQSLPSANSSSAADKPAENKNVGNSDAKTYNETQQKQTANSGYSGTQKQESSQTAKMESRTDVPEQKKAASVPALPEIQMFDKPAATMAEATAVNALPTAWNAVWGISVDNTASAAEQIMLIASDSGAQQVAGDSGVVALKSLAPSAKKVLPEDKVILKFKVLNSNYDLFISRLQKFFGTQWVMPVTVKAMDMTGSIASYQKQIAELEVRIKAMEKDTSYLNNEIMEQMKNEKSRLQSQMENLQANAQYSFVLVEVKTK